MDRRSSAASVKLAYLELGALWVVLPAAFMLVVPGRPIFSQADSAAVRTARLDAVGLLQFRETGPLIAETQTIDSLAKALLAIRFRFPETRDVRAMLRPGIVVVYDSAYSSVLEKTMVHEKPSGEEDPNFKWLTRTGDSAFDALTRRIGGAQLRAWLFLGAQRIIVDLNETVATRLDSATVLYGQLPHVSEVFSDLIVGDHSSVQVRKVAGDWEFTFYRGWGDCPAGCINRHVEVIVYQPRTGSVRLVSETGPKPRTTQR